MKPITPESCSRRSFVYRQLAAASFAEIAGGALAMDLKNDRNQAEKSGLLDLSVLPRAAYRGVNAAAHLKAAGLPAPAQPNQASLSANGEWVLRLSQQEFWVLGAWEDKGVGVETLKRLQAPDGCLPLYCQDSHAWFTLTGAHLSETLAKICGVDLRAAAFGLGSIAQTSAARINVIVMHHQINELPCFSILCDSAAAQYLWECLLDAMDEFGGEAIGASAMDRISQPHQQNQRPLP